MRLHEIDQRAFELLQRITAEIDETPAKWTQNVHARNQKGDEVPPESPDACCWCLTGFIVRERRLGNVSPPVATSAMYILRSYLGNVVHFNDHIATSAAHVLRRLKHFRPQSDSKHHFEFELFADGSRTFTCKTCGQLKSHKNHLATANYTTARLHQQRLWALIRYCKELGYERKHQRRLNELYRWQYFERRGEAVIALPSWWV